MLLEVAFFPLVAGSDAKASTGEDGVGEVVVV